MRKCARKLPAFLWMTRADSEVKRVKPWRELFITFASLISTFFFFRAVLRLMSVSPFFVNSALIIISRYQLFILHLKNSHTRRKFKSAENCLLVNRLENENCWEFQVSRFVQKRVNNPSFAFSPPFFCYCAFALVVVNGKLSTVNPYLHKHNFFLSLPRPLAAPNPISKNRTLLLHANVPFIPPKKPDYPTAATSLFRSREDCAHMQMGKLFPLPFPKRRNFPIKITYLCMLTLRCREQRWILEGNEC